MIDASLTQKIAEVASASSLLVASDFDGVLSPIVADPASAQSDVVALAALVRLGLMPATYAAVISGRSRATLVELTGGPEGLTMIGTHGAEPHAEPTGLGMSSDTRVIDLQSDLLALARQYPGCEVELKPIGAAFHYRNSKNGENAAAQAHRIAGAAGARAIAGKKVVECVFGEASKGSALESLRNQLGAESVVFIGDDTTDEDAFGVLGKKDLSIKVGAGPTGALHRIGSQQDVAEVMLALESARRR